MLEADDEENEIDVGDHNDDDDDVMYMAASHPAPSYDYESIQYDVELGSDDDDRGSLDEVNMIKYILKCNVFHKFPICFRTVFPTTSPPGSSARRLFERKKERETLS
jgi:hypothetical protein